MRRGNGRRKTQVSVLLAGLAMDGTLKTRWSIRLNSCRNDNQGRRLANEQQSAYVCRRHVLRRMMRSGSRMRRDSDILNHKRRDQSCVRKIQQSNGLEECSWSIPHHKSRTEEIGEHGAD